MGRDRISKLSERMNNSGSKLNHNEHDGNDRALRVDHLANRVSYLNDKVTELSETQNKKFNQLKENIYKLRSNLDDERLNKEDKFNAKIQELQNIESRFTATIDTEVKNRKDSETRLLRT